MNSTTWGKTADCCQTADRNFNFWVMSSLNGFYYSSGLNPSSTSLLLVSEKFWKKSGESTGFDEVEAEESQSWSSIFHLFVYLLISHMKFTPQTEKSALSYTYDKTRELGRDYYRLELRPRESLNSATITRRTEYNARNCQCANKCDRNYKSISW